MKAFTMLAKLESLGVMPSFSRLGISNDNPYSESLFRTMNVDENQDVATLLGIQSIPTMIIFKNNKEIQRFVGVQSEGILSDAMDRLLT